jgi:hypothetical protein
MKDVQQLSVDQLHMTQTVGQKNNTVELPGILDVPAVI